MYSNTKINTFACMKKNDTFLYQGLRQRMIQMLEEKFAFDKNVLEAMTRVPRHLFVAKGLEMLSYHDKPLPIAAGQTISQPYTVAMQTHLLSVQPWLKVLEIGTGCGYQAAILVEMGVKVYTIERQKELFLQAKKILSELNYPVISFLGDGYEGKPLLAPFDRIIITCGAPQIPEKLLTQLAVGGRMVIPVGKAMQTMTIVERLTENDYKTSTHGTYCFVPMLEGIANK